MAISVVQVRVARDKHPKWDSCGWSLCSVQLVKVFGGVFSVQTCKIRNFPGENLRFVRRRHLDMAICDAVCETGSRLVVLRRDPVWLRLGRKSCMAFRVGSRRRDPVSKRLQTSGQLGTSKFHVAPPSHPLNNAFDPKGCMAV